MLLGAVTVVVAAVLGHRRESPRLVWLAWASGGLIAISALAAQAWLTMSGGFSSSDGVILRGLPALAVSIASLDGAHVDTAARLAALLCRQVRSGGLPPDLFLNVNLPEKSGDKLKGICITRLAHRTHIETVDEAHAGLRAYYGLVRQKLAAERDHDTDLGAIERGYISITALQAALFGKPPLAVPADFCERLFQQLLTPE
jgi:broad specificity polyphosphatase/5'/3'-nucleotidase SurE